MIVPILLLQAAIHLGGDEVTEASGLVVSPTQEGIFWTHNDSGDAAYLYAFDKSGKPKATVLVRNAFNFDWEDLAVGPMPGKSGTWLYAADIGDNSVNRTEPCIYAIAEPKVGRSNRAKPLLSTDAIRFLLKYPDGPHNAETLLCDPRNGRLTIVTKEPSGVSGIYRLPADPSPRKANLLEKLGQFQVPRGASTLVTGGSYRPDGGGVALVTYTHLIELKGDEFWTATPSVRPQPALQQLEAVAYSRDGKSIWLTSEGKNAPLVDLPATP
jgi:hypothetical protein